MRTLTEQYAIPTHNFQASGLFCGEWSLERHGDEFISAWLKEPELLRKMSTTVIGGSPEAV
jgi:hypothetical protein